jgi:5-(carboxyamino)imidazole ribonucleotide mutase/phosphoribosylaminoimidazole-succinocarboxamide synthase
MDAFVPIIMGSPSDMSHAEAVGEALSALGIAFEIRVASAHKVPAYALEILQAYEADPRPKVYITIAGRSNALSGFVDAQVSAPVIACPPPSSSFGGADVYSSLRMPSGVAPAVVLEAQNAALLAAKIFGLISTETRNKVAQQQQANRERLIQEDQELRGAR